MQKRTLFVKIPSRQTSERKSSRGTGIVAVVSGGCRRGEMGGRVMLYVG